MGTDVAVARNALAEFFEKNKQQIQMALPKHLNPDRMCRLALTAFSQNSALQNCGINTIFASVVIASQLGLEIGVAGQGFLVPYKGKCTFVPGWQGLVDLVSRSGRGTVWTGAVYEGDDFDWALGDRPFVKHKPKRRASGDDPIYTYAVGRSKGSDWPVIEVWDDSSLREHRDKFNKVGEKHYSYGNWEMYARKVPLLQVIKYLPKSIELANAIALEGAYAEGKTAILEGDFIRVDDDAPTDGAGPQVGGPSEKTDAGQHTAAPANPQGSATAADQRAGGGGAASQSKEDDKPLTEGAKTTLRAAMQRSGKTETDLDVAGFGKIEGMKFSKFNDVMAWARKPAAT